MLKISFHGLKKNKVEFEPFRIFVASWSTLDQHALLAPRVGKWKSTIKLENQRRTIDTTYHEKKSAAIYCVRRKAILARNFSNFRPNAKFVRYVCEIEWRMLSLFYFFRNF